MGTQVLVKIPAVVAQARAPHAFVLLFADLVARVEQSFQGIHDGGVHRRSNADVPVFERSSFFTRPLVHLKVSQRLVGDGPRRADGVVHALVQQGPVEINFVGDLGNSRFDEAFGKVLNAQNQVGHAEGKVHTKLGGQDQGHAGFSRVFNRQRVTGASDVAGRFADVQRVADLCAILGELI